jgi:hypothetical protein
LRVSEAMKACRMRRMRGDEAFFFLLAVVVFFLVAGFLVEEVLEEEEDEDCANALGSNGENSPLLTAKLNTKTMNQR